MASSVEVRVSSEGEETVVNYEVWVDDNMMVKARYSHLRAYAEKIKLKTRAKLPSFPRKSSIFETHDKKFLDERRSGMENFFQQLAAQDFGTLESIICGEADQKENDKVIMSMDRNSHKEASLIGTRQQEVTALRREVQAIERLRCNKESEWKCNQVSYENRENALKIHIAALKKLKSNFGIEDAHQEEEEAQNKTTEQRLIVESQVASEKVSESKKKLGEIKAKLQAQRSMAQDSLSLAKEKKKQAVTCEAAARIRCQIAVESLSQVEEKLHAARQHAEITKKIHNEKHIAAIRLKETLLDDALCKRDEAQAAVDQVNLELKKHTETLDRELALLKTKLNECDRHSSRISAIAALQDTRKLASDAAPQDDSSLSAQANKILNVSNENRLVQEARDALLHAQSTGADTTKQFEQRLDCAKRVLESRQLVLDQAISRYNQRQELVDSADEEAATAQAIVQALEEDLVQIKNNCHQLQIELDHATEAKQNVENIIAETHEKACADEKPILRELHAESVVFERLSASFISLDSALHILKIQNHETAENEISTFDDHEDLPLSTDTIPEKEPRQVSPSNFLDEEILHTDRALATLLEEVHVATNAMNESKAQQEKRELDLKSQLQVAETALALEEEDHQATNQLRLTLQATSAAQ